MGMQGIFLAGKVAAHWKVMGHSMVSCAKTAEPIEMPFGANTLVGPRHHNSKGVEIPHGNGHF